MKLRVDMLAPEVHADVYRVYAELRRQSPVCQVEPGGLWAVTRYSDVVQVLKDTAVFSSRSALMQPEWLGRNPLAGSIIFQDPPLHTKLRALLSKMFSPRGIALLERRIRAIAEELADHFSAGTTIEFMSEFAILLPSMVICELLGLDLSLYKHFNRWAQDTASITPMPPSPARIAEIRASITELEGYMSQVIAARRRAPAEDAVSELVHAELAGATLTDDELVAQMFTLLSAGFETTMLLLGNAMLTLTEHPECVARLRAEPAQLPAFLEEVLRLRPPSHGIFRWTTADAEVAGTTIPRGSMVYVLIGSALRDEREFPEPDRFDMDRGVSANLAFGHGIHFCVGAPLARLEGRLGLAALLSRFTHFSLDAAGLQWKHSLWTHGPERLPIHLSRH